MFPGNRLDYLRRPTLEFIMRMIVTAILGEWDWSHQELVRIDVTKLFRNEEWMRYVTVKKFRKHLETSARVLVEIFKFQRARNGLAALAVDWFRYLVENSLKYVKVPEQQPASLKETARFVIRRSLKVPLFQSLENLMIPEKMKDYILLADELQALVNVRQIINCVRQNGNTGN